jgi:predicted RNA polymerase sigma factor
VAVHDEAATADDADWPQNPRPLRAAGADDRNPIVTLNRAVAAAMVDGPATGLALLEGIDERLAGHHRLDGPRAPPAGDDRRPRRGDRALPDGGGAHDRRGGA